MALIITQTTDTGANLGKQLSSNNTDVAEWVNNLSRDANIRFRLSLSGLDANIATFTYATKIGSSLATQPESFVKTSTSDQISHFETNPILVKNGETVTIRVHSTNASDSAVDTTGEVVDLQAGIDVRAISSAPPPSVPDNFSDMNINTDGEVDVTLRNNEQYGPLNT